PLNPAPRLVGNSWIDSFARNTTFTYELSLGSIRSLRDITEISLRNTGADALCVERIDLLVNGGTAMTKNFGATCRNIETESGSPHQPEIVIPFEELRATSSFTGFVSPGFAPITRGEVEARLEGLVGEKIWNTKAKWGKFSGNRAVEASRTNASTLHVDLDLEGIINNLPNVEVDVDFDLVVALARSGAGWNLTFDVTNIVAGADFPWWTEVLGGSLGVVVGGVTYYGIEALERHIEEQIQSSFTFAQVGAPFGDAACPAPSVPFVTVNVNAGLDIGCTL
ncbi:MAG TPA: hypothetical protein VK427_07855, partial [Kofleriaceae bacterium]|nr:hypothetical protein [Kofleriaceae bacterium]